MTVRKTTCIALALTAALAASAAFAQEVELHDGEFTAWTNLWVPTSQPGAPERAEDQEPVDGYIWHGLPVMVRPAWVLFWSFDIENPEVLVKVLDGRGENGRWWLDVAVASDLSWETVVCKGPYCWRVITGRGRDINFRLRSPVGENERAYCAMRQFRGVVAGPMRPCEIEGRGTSLSLRWAWVASER